MRERMQQHATESNHTVHEYEAAGARMRDTECTQVFARLNVVSQQLTSAMTSLTSLTTQHDDVTNQQAQQQRVMEEKMLVMTQQIQQYEREIQIHRGIVEKEVSAASCVVG